MRGAGGLFVASGTTKWLWKKFCRKRKSIFCHLFHTQKHALVSPIFHVADSVCFLTVSALSFFWKGLHPRRCKPRSEDVNIHKPECDKMMHFSIKRRKRRRQRRDGIDEVFSVARRGRVRVKLRFKNFHKQRDTASLHDVCFFRYGSELVYFPRDYEPQKRAGLFK